MVVQEQGFLKPCKPDTRRPGVLAFQEAARQLWALELWAGNNRDPKTLCGFIFQNWFLEDRGTFTSAPPTVDFGPLNVLELRTTSK